MPETDRPLTHRHVVVAVDLSNGRRWSCAWTTPLPLGRALSKGYGWARREMSAQKIRGRSSVKYVQVSASVRPGAFNDEGN